MLVALAFARSVFSVLGNLLPLKAILILATAHVPGFLPNFLSAQAPQIAALWLVLAGASSSLLSVAINKISHSSGAASLYMRRTQSTLDDFLEAMKSAEISASVGLLLLFVFLALVSFPFLPLVVIGWIIGLAGVTSSIVARRPHFGGFATFLTAFERTFLPAVRKSSLWIVLTAALAGAFFVLDPDSFSLILISAIVMRRAIPLFTKLFHPTVMRISRFRSRDGVRNDDKLPVNPSPGHLLSDVGAKKSIEAEIAAACGYALPLDLTAIADSDARSLSFHSATARTFFRVFPKDTRSFAAREQFFRESALWRKFSMFDESNLMSIRGRPVIVLAPREELRDSGENQVSRSALRETTDHLRQLCINHQDLVRQLGKVNIPSVLARWEQVLFRAGQLDPALRDSIMLLLDEIGPPSLYWESPPGVISVGKTLNVFSVLPRRDGLVEPLSLMAWSVRPDILQLRALDTPFASSATEEFDSWGEVHANYTESIGSSPALIRGFWLELLTSLESYQLRKSSALVGRMQSVLENRLSP